MKSNVVLLLAVVLGLMLTVQSALGDLEIDAETITVLVNGDALEPDAEGDFVVFPGDTVEIEFEVSNENSSAAVGGVETTLEFSTTQIENQSHACGGVSCAGGIWRLAAGSREIDSFMFEVPLSISGAGFGALLAVSHDGAAGVSVTDPLNLSFEIEREDFAIELLEDSIEISSATLQCNPETDLAFTIVNTGSRAFTASFPAQVLVYSEDAASTTFNERSGEFDVAEGGELQLLYEENLRPLAPGAQADEEITIDTSNLPAGGHTLSFYIVSPHFMADASTGFFVSGSGMVDITKSSCLVSSQPSSGSLVLRPGVSQQFQVLLAQAGALVEWFVDGSSTRAATGNSFTTSFTATGAHTVRALVNANQGEERTWSVQVSNVPLSSSFSHNVPADATSAQLAAFPDFRVSNSAGQVVFGANVDLRNVLNLDEVFVITADTAAVDTALAPALANVPAAITFNRNFRNPVVQHSSGFNEGPFADCAECEVVSSTATAFVISVPGFSTYRVLEEEPASLDITALEFEGVNRGQTAQLNVTVRNPGTVETLREVQVSFVGVTAGYNAQAVGNVPATIAPGGEFTLQVQISVPAEEVSGRHSIGTFRVGALDPAGNTVTESANIFLSPRSLLTLEKVEIDGKATGKLLLDESTEITIRVQNDAAQDMESIVVRATLLDVDGDDLEEESEEFDLRPGRDKEVTFEFDLQDEELDEDSYTLEIEVEGETEDGAEHRVLETRTVEVDRNRHEVAIRGTPRLGQNTLQCLRQTNLQVTVQNVGKSDEDEVSIVVRSEELGLELLRDNIELDDYGGSDNDYTATFALELEDAEPGSYTLMVEVYRDDTLDDSREVLLEIQECGASEAGERQQQLSREDLVRQLQQQLQARREQQDTGEEPQFRQSRTYLWLLGVLALLVIVAGVLAVAVAARRDRKHKDRE